MTSLPELASGISAVTVMDAPNLAVGNALGACVFNLVFLVVIDALQRRQPIYRHASAARRLSAAFGVVMLGFVAMSLLLPGTTPAAAPGAVQPGAAGALPAGAAQRFCERAVAALRAASGDCARQRRSHGAAHAWIKARMDPLWLGGAR